MSAAFHPPETDSSSLGDKCDSDSPLRAPFPLAKMSVERALSALS